MEFFIFRDKLGAENLLLVLVGVLHFSIFWMRRKDARVYHRLFLHLWEALFFVCYGILFDLYRYRFFLDLILGRYSFKNVAIWRMIVLFFFLCPVYATLAKDALLCFANRKRRSSRLYSMPAAQESWWRSLTLAFWTRHATTQEEAVNLDREILTRINMIEETLSTRVWEDLNDVKRMVADAHQFVQERQAQLDTEKPPALPK